MLKIKADSRASQLEAFKKTGANYLLPKIRKDFPYKFPKHYLSWDSLSLLIALICENWNQSQFDWATRLNNHRTGLWLAKKAPIYCLDSSLLNKFQESDVSYKSVLSDLCEEAPLDSLMILLPQIIQSPDGGILDYLIVHISDIRFPERSEAKIYDLFFPRLTHHFDINLQWSCADSQGTVWFSGCGIENGQIKETGIDCGRNAVSEKDRIFLSKIRDIIINSLLFLKYEQPTAVAVKSSEFIESSRGFAKPSKDEKVIYPRWLREAEKPTYSNSDGCANNHVSPSAHWRRGHWRSQPVGQGRLQREWKWIRPCFIAGD